MVFLRSQKEATARSSCGSATSHGASRSTSEYDRTTNVHPDDSYSVSERAQNTGVALRRKLQNNRKQHNAEARVYRSAATSQDVRDLSLVPHPSRAGHGDTSQFLSARFGMADGYGANRRKVNSEGDGGRR